MMNLMEILLNPISIVFIVLILGYYLGRIKCLGISLDLSGVLILAVVLGWAISSSDVIKGTIDIQTFQSNMQMFSSLGTSLFVSVIGITTGYSLNLRTAKNIKAIIIGVLMVVSSFCIMNLISVFDKNISYSKLLGALCGALTTTPGLSAVAELKTVMAEEATVAYGCTYLLGVTAAVLCVQILAQKSESVFEIDRKNTDESKSALGGLIQIGVTVILGRLFGSVRFGTFTLGQSGGMLCAGIALGIIIKVFFAQRIVSTKMMGIYRNFGLILFFAGNGIPAGMSFKNGFDIKVILYGALMAIMAIVVGMLLSRLMLRDGGSSWVIAGGMTSTPAIGVLLRKQSQVSLDSYSLAYMGALLTVILLIRSL